MRRGDTIQLDTHYLVERIEVLGLKQWWIARELGVDRKTVSRWVTGKVKRLSRDSAARLAELLGCPESRLTVRDEADVLATREEQRAAAALIEEQDLLQLLSPTDNWELAEGLIKATLQPDLPLGQLGRLYNLLSIAAWRQGKYELGRRHAERAEELGERAGERAVVVGSWSNQATIDSLKGDQRRALELYEACTAAGEQFDTPRDLAKVWSNLGDVYRSFLRLEDSLRAQRESVRLFEELGLDFNLAISWFSMGHARTEAGRFPEAQEDYRRGGEHAARASYTRGVDCAAIYVTDPTSLGGQVEQAREQLEVALPALARHSIYDLACHEIAARVRRRAGDLGGAREQLAEGLRRAEGFPELRGHLLVEEARCEHAAADPQAASRAAEAARAAFSEAGVEARAPGRPLTEHGGGALA
jgi:tetratricopeptide (TPR) repeat protein